MEKLKNVNVNSVNIQDKMTVIENELLKEKSETLRLEQEKKNLEMSNEVLSLDCQKYIECFEELKKENEDLKNELQLWEVYSEEALGENDDISMLNDENKKLTDELNNSRDQLKKKSKEIKEKDSCYLMQSQNLKKSNLEVTTLKKK